MLRANFRSIKVSRSITDLAPLRCATKVIDDIASWHGAHYWYLSQRTDPLIGVRTSLDSGHEINQPAQWR